jgi:uncharacterized protein (TIGR03067 family)
VEVDMRSSAILIVALFPLMAAGGDDAKEKAIKAELEKLRGKWKQVSVEIDGKERAVPATVEVVVTIDGDRWKAVSPKEFPESTFTIDPTKDPKTFDRIRKDKDDAKKDVVDKCIYKLDGDTLTICSGYTPGGGKAAYGTAERPKEFKTTGGGVIFVYKRIKE